MRRALSLLLAAGVVAVVVLGLSQASEDKPERPPAGFDVDAALRALKGAPAPLAALHRQPSALLGGGLPAFRARLKTLRGYPVVINKWGSWCAPCRAEFPIFQRVAARKGKTVAFLGIDGGDNPQEAREFLDDFPVPYPSYVDPREQIARAVDAPAAYPITIFVDRRGKVVIPLAKPYATVAELEADIRRYLRA